MRQIVQICADRRLTIVAVFLLLATLGIAASVTRLGMSTDIGGLFSMSLGWKQQEAALARAYPQFENLIVAVIDADIPEEADATATGLVRALAGAPHIRDARRPDASPYLQHEGLLFLDAASLSALLDATVDAAPFLGQLAADPSARGLFSALGLIGQGVVRGQANLTPFLPALRGFHAALSQAAAGHPAPLSWQALLAGKLAALAGPSRIVLIQPALDYRAVQPGGAATATIRAAASGLEFVAGGQARLRLTGSVPLADEEFSSAAGGALMGLLISMALVVLWLFLALRSWRLILPVVATLLMGLILTTGFAALAVGTLNLISVAFAILFVGIAVDFAIQFCARLREQQAETPELSAALAATGGRVGRQIAVAGLATSAGFLAFVPTSFRGVAELGLIAGIGMLIALLCTLTFLPAMLSLCRPQPGTGEPGIAGLAPADRAITLLRWPILAAAAAAFLGGGALTPRLHFDSNTLHTKNQHSEAMQTLLHLLDSPVTNPFTSTIVRPSLAAADAVVPALSRLSLVDHVIGLSSFVPGDQPAKLAAIADAATILGPILAPQPTKPPPNATALRAAIAACLAQLTPAIAQLGPTHPLAAIAGDLRALQTAPDPTLLAANTALVGFLPQQLERLRLALSAQPVTARDVPPDISRDYLQPDGAARLMVVPKSSVLDSAVLRQFADQVRGVAPDAGGPAIAIDWTARTILGAFRQAALWAVLAISAILLIALRRPLDAALVLAPLLLSAAMTVLVMIASGLGLNYANIIALPLLLGVGVSFNIYFIMNWRAGAPPRLTSATTRAVVFSALTTGTAFGSLAVSAHPGTASMGTLLLISLGCTLLASLVFVPAALRG